LNVTIPYKEKIIHYLDELDGTAKEIGAVNTIKIFRKNRIIFLKGYNTDSEAFRISADFRGYSKAIILGTGGSAKAVKFALNKLGIQSLFVSRHKRNSETIVYTGLTREMLSKYTLIINATPVGMYPETGASPDIPYHFLTQFHFLYDLIYNPEMTLFLQFGKERNAGIQNGLKMLQIQAEKSYEIWNTITP
jgi:shikimate dehydrogenase